MPTGLSSTIQPCTSRFGRFCWRWPRRASGAALVVESFIVIVLLVQLALDHRCSPKLLGSFGLFESLVDAESILGSKRQVNATCNLVVSKLLLRPSASSRIAPILGVLRAQVALHYGCSQKLLDSFGFVESFVDAESNLRCEFQVNAMRDL